MTRDHKRQSGLWRRAIETIRAWENAMDYTPYDYALDRIGALERQVSQLRDELRAMPAVNWVDGRAERASLAEIGN
jgi:hypothetical protein